MADPKGLKSQSRGIAEILDPGSIERISDASAGACRSAETEEVEPADQPGNQSNLQRSHPAISRKTGSVPGEHGRGPLRQLTAEARRRGENTKQLTARLALASAGIRARLQSCRKCFKLTRAFSP